MCKFALVMGNLLRNWATVAGPSWISHLLNFLSTFTEKSQFALTSEGNHDI